MPVSANTVGLIVAVATELPMLAPPACMPVAVAVVSAVDTMATVAPAPAFRVPLPRSMPSVGVKLALAPVNCPLNTPPPPAKASASTMWLAVPSTMI